jgi:hypothetical protein
MRELGETNRDLEAEKEVALDFIDQNLQIRHPTRELPPPGRGPHPRPLEARARALRSVDTDWVEARLGEIPGKDAGRIRGNVRSLRRRLSELDRELGTAREELKRARALARGIRTRGSGTPPSVEKSVSEAEKTKVEGRAAESGEILKESETAGEILKESESVGRVPRLASRLGTTLEVAGFLAEVLGPWLELILVWAGSLAEAKERLKHEYYGLGFAEGMAANLLGFSAKEATEMLIYPDTSRGTVGAQVAGFGGVRQPPTLSGRRDGWKFAAQLSSKLRGAFIEEGLARMKDKNSKIFAIIKEKGHTIGPTFNFDDVVEFAIPLKAINEELAEAARVQEETRRINELNQRLWKEGALPGQSKIPTD